MTEKVPPRVHPPERLEATFLTSAPSLKQCPNDAVPEVAIAGRSNAGKSSVLNRLTGNRRTAKVSKTPGRTQLLNLFDVRSGGRLVDLPGYGYAKAAKSAQANWQQSVNEYLSYRENLRGIVIVMDIRHPCQGFDVELLEWTDASSLATHVLLNKADKLSYSKQQQALNKFINDHRNFSHLSAQTFSATSGKGKEKLIELLLDWLAR